VHRYSFVDETLRQRRRVEEIGHSVRTVAAARGKTIDFFQILFRRRLRRVRIRTRFLSVLRGNYLQTVVLVV